MLFFQIKKQTNALLLVKGEKVLQICTRWVCVVVWMTASLRMLKDDSVNKGQQEDESKVNMWITV